MLNSEDPHCWMPEAFGAIEPQSSAANDDGGLTPSPFTYTG
jgi:hypothetical protein